MKSANKAVWPMRVACVTVAALALFFVIRRIQPHALAQTFHHMHAAWFVAASILYGLLFVPASIRWHIALRLSGSAIDLATSLRLSLIGHFFYTVLFGAAGGDVAKSAVYARQHGLLLPNILAASSLDRLLGSVGLLLFSAVAFGIALANGGLMPLEHLTMRLPGPWMVIAVALVLVLAWLIFRSRRGSLWDRFVTAFLTSGKKLIASPKNFLAGVLCGIAVQLSLSGVLALNLQAVSTSPVPWERLIWTFPVISIISALPVTVAGLGVRDSTALLFFGWYNVSGADAVAASLLTATAGLWWTIVGGILLWRETIKRSPTASNDRESPDTGPTGQVSEAPGQ
jgi:uncharacterized membrane protein YbhN (UPF0104 family)